MATQQASNPPLQTKPGRGGQVRVEDQGASDQRNAGRAREEEADDEELDGELDDEDDDEDEDDEDEEA